MTKNLRYGVVYDIDLNSHDCDYELKNKIFSKIQNKTLLDVFENFLKDSSSYSQGAQNQLKDIENLSNKEAVKKFNFEEFRNSKIEPSQKIFCENSFSKNSILNFNLMKSILGHISINSAEENNINSVPIYCLSFSTDNDMIFTGDNNG